MSALLFKKVNEVMQSIQLQMMSKRFLSMSIRLERAETSKHVSEPLKVSPYILFVKEQYAKKTNIVANGNAVENMRKIAATWKSLPDNEKQAFTMKSDKLREERARAFEQLSDEEKEEQLAASRNRRTERAMRKERRERRKLWEETNHPSKPLSGYQLFVKEQFEARKKSGLSLTPVVDILKGATDLWKSMDTGKKEMYNTKSEKLREVYKTELAAWENRINKVQAEKK